MGCFLSFFLLVYLFNILIVVPSRQFQRRSETQSINITINESQAHAMVPLMAFFKYEKYLLVRAYDKLVLILFSQF